ncbi:glycosyltransferase family 9 protein [[Limnothrix rosea] IAM M-220]|uniref:glycosyltransferase family 9 protein n=1 Tax=[Limnothrix rosea] IAM M-220 TaxID=454133 RepID=UPI0009609809|nr:glycosyltransferase family 9 protein [[Limnothrix rosea] IAM M-220]OKH17264.1 glycosyltransferase [[Limnothrix rosea] IAM M-220]
MRILALVPGGVGDQILFFPTLADLKDQYPEAMVDVLVEPRAKAAYRVCPTVHEVLTFDFKDRNGPADYLNILGTIRDREYEIAITFGQSWIVSLLLWLNGIPTRIGYKTETSWFISNNAPLNEDQYKANTYHDLLKGLDIDKPCGAPKINVPNSDIQWAEAEQKRLSINDGYVLIHAGASRVSQSQGIRKLYPIEKWQEIIADIQGKQPNLPIVLLHGPEDYDWVTQLVELFPDLRVTLPEDVGKSAAMIAGANLVVCTDSAPMHLAVAVGTYTVALFGPTKMERLLPPQTDKFIGIQSPTGRIEDIKPTEVLAKIWR